MKNESIQTQNKFIESAIKGKILVNKCRNCGQLMLETVYYCPVCSKSDFELVEFDGIGTVVTHTIQAVAPEGFEDLDSYAWVVFSVDNRPQACRRPRRPMPAPRATRLRRRSLPRLPPAPSPRRPPGRPGPRTGSPTSGAGSGYPHRAVMRAFIQVAVAATPPHEKRCPPTPVLALPERAWRASALS